MWPFTTTPKHKITDLPAAFLTQFPRDPRLSAEFKRLVPQVEWSTQHDGYVVAAQYAPELRDFAETMRFWVGNPERLNLLAQEFSEAVWSSGAISGHYPITDFPELRPYQQMGVRYCATHKSVILGDEAGLGKTAQALATLHHLSALPALVVVPASVLLQWQHEQIPRWMPWASVAVLKRGVTAPASDIYLVTYDTLRLLQNIPPHVALVLDESHYVKNMDAKRSIAAYLTARGIPVRLLLTGTAVLNRPDELVSQLDILGRLSQFGGEDYFRKKYRHANHADLHRRLRGCCYVRRDKSDVLMELPPVTTSIVPVELSNDDEYRWAESDLLSWAALHGYDMAATLRQELFTRTTHLRRLAGEGKVQAGIDWLANLSQAGEKVVVFGHHGSVIQQIASAFSSPCIVGGMSPEQRNKSIQRFVNGDAPIIAISLQAGNAGIDALAKASHHVAFFEFGWTPAIHQQATARLHRMGQQFPVTAHYLVATDSIEREMLSLLDDKAVVTQRVLAGNDDVLKIGKLVQEVLA